MSWKGRGSSLNRAEMENYQPFPSTRLTHPHANSTPLALTLTLYPHHPKPTRTNAVSRRPHYPNLQPLVQPEAQNCSSNFGRATFSVASLLVVAAIALVLLHGMAGPVSALVAHGTLQSQSSMRGCVAFLFLHHRASRECRPGNVKRTRLYNSPLGGSEPLMQPLVPLGGAMTPTSTS